MLIIVAFLILGGLLLLLVGFLLWDRLRQGQRWQQQGDTLSKAVGDRIDGTIKVFGELQKGIGELAEKAKGIEEAGKNILTLQEILRTPKPRGGLGEFLLERLLADSLPRDVYALQWRFHSGETVDAVVRIGGSMVPIDAKFPLEDFERMVAAESDEERATIRKQFARTVKKHIDDVAKYILPDENTFDFALMYVPAENIYYETGLRGLRIERATREILGRLQRLQGEFGSFQRDYETLGGHIHRATAKYDEASVRLTRLGDKLQLTGEAPPGELPEGDEETSSQPD